jgi:hypothetical protein
MNRILNARRRTVIGLHSFHIYVAERKWFPTKLLTRPRSSMISFTSNGHMNDMNIKIPDFELSALQHKSIDST